MQLSVTCNAELKGLPFVVSDNIAVEGRSFNCGLKLLKDFKSPYTATVVEKLLSAGCVPVEKTDTDESCIGISKGNAVRLKPTYGAVSRYGLASYTSSLETIGIFSDTISLCRKVFNVIRGKDNKDQISRDAPETAPALFGGDLKKRGVIGVLSFKDGVRGGYEKTKTILSNLGYTLKEVELPCLKYCAPAYYAIAAAETSANLARFDGIRYGKRSVYIEDIDGLICASRSEGFNSDVKLQILLGTFILRSGFKDQYYVQAQNIRAGIKKNFEALLGDSGYSSAAGICDAILLPVIPEETFCANLTGLPALTIHASVENGLPAGVQLIGRAFAEGTLLNIAEDYENTHPLSN